MRTKLLIAATGIIVVAIFAGITRNQWLPIFLSPDSFGNEDVVASSQIDTSDDAENPSLSQSSDENNKGSLSDSSESNDRRSLSASEEPETDPAKLKPDAQSATSKSPSNAGDAKSDNAKSDKTEDEEPVAEEEQAVPIETVEGQTINPNLAGRLEVAHRSRIKGWVRDKTEPESTIKVEIQIDDQVAYTLTATKRVEHKKLGVIWYFEQKTPTELADSEKHVVRALAFRIDQHGKTELQWSPRNVATGTFPRGKLEEASPEHGFSGYAWDPDSWKKTPVKIVLKIDGETVAEVKADQSNPELKKRRIAPGDALAFKVDWPKQLDDGLDHTVQAFAVDNESNTEHELDGSPRVVNSLSGSANQPPIGRFDIANKSVLAGWAYDPDAFNGPIDVEIWIDGKRYTQIPANSTRVTLRNSKVCPDPDHGFVYSTPGELLDGKTHTIRMYALDHPGGLKVELQGSPRIYRMEENTPPMGGYWRLDEKSMRGWAHDPDLGVEACDIEIYIDNKLWKRTKADRKETWILGTGFATNPEHGFNIKPPDWIRDGEPHEVRILAINYPEGPPKDLGTRTFGVNSIYPGFWTEDRLRDTRVTQGLYVRGVSPWYDAYHKDVKTGDVLLEYDGIEAGVKEIKDKDGNVTTAGTMTRDFKTWLNLNKKNKETVKLKFWRDGETYEVTVKVGQLKGK